MHISFVNTYKTIINTVAKNSRTEAHVSQGHVPSQTSNSVSRVSWMASNSHSAST